MVKLAQVERCSACPWGRQDLAGFGDDSRAVIDCYHPERPAMQREGMWHSIPDWCPLEDDPTPGFVDALRPFVHLADVMQPGDVLVYAGVCVTYEDVLAAKAAHEKAQG